MKTRIAGGLVLAAGIIGAASCLMVMEPVDSEQPGVPLAARQEIHRTLEFEPGGTLSLQNALGDVDISGWDKDQVDVLAKVNGNETNEEARIRLLGPWNYGPDADIRKTDHSVAINTRPAELGRKPQRLDYSINVPSSIDLRRIVVDRGDVTLSDLYGRLDVDVKDGSLKVENFSGSINGAIGTGQADIEVLDIRPDDVMTVIVQRGDITLRLQPDANIRIDAQAPDGEVTSDLDMGQVLPARTLKGRMGEGAAGITLKALAGNIRILKTS